MQILVVNNLGQAVITEKINASSNYGLKHELNISALSKGLYTILVKGDTLGIVSKN